MENKILRFTMRDLTEKSSKKLIKLNDESINYGLVLSENDVNNIMKHTTETLTKIGRIETSTSSLEKIIEIVYSSPYTDKENYVENINDMQEIFYYFKSEVLDLISDDEVIEILEKTYEDKKGEMFQIQGAIDDFAKEFKLTGGL